MASPRRRAALTLEERLFGEPDRIDAFQLVRLLHVRDTSRTDASIRQKEGLWHRLASGESDRRSFVDFARRVRFRADLSPAFPGREVTSCLPVEGDVASDRVAAVMGRRRLDGDIVELRTPNYCVASELGPLPEPFLEWVRERLQADDESFAAFLDLFNHRINVLRHQLKSSQDVALDPALPQDTLQADFLACIAGVASPAAQAQVGLPKRAWLGLTASLADPRRSAIAAITALRQYLGVPAARLVPLVGHWRMRAPSLWTRLDGRHGLGAQTVLGTRAWDQMAGVYLRVPDVDYEKLCALLPPAFDPTSAVNEPPQQNCNGAHARAGRGDTFPLDGYAGLAQMVRLLFDRRVDCVVSLTTRADRLPPSLLTAEPGSAATAPSMTAASTPGVQYRGLRLGQTAWLAASGKTGSGMRRVRYAIAAEKSTEAIQWT